MPDAHALLVFAAAALTMLVVPGPSVIFIVTRSVDQGRTAGLVSVLGIHAGTLVHVTAAAVGVSALLVRSALAFNVVKWAGVAYLIVLGVRRLVGRGSHDELVKGTGAHRSFRRLFVQGAVVNVLNPKTALFFFAFLPQFVDAGSTSPVAQTFCLGLVFVLLGMCTDGTYALLGARLGRWLRSARSFRRVERFVVGSTLVGLGVGAALAGSRAHD